MKLLLDTSHLRDCYDQWYLETESLLLLNLSAVHYLKRNKDGVWLNAGANPTATYFQLCDEWQEILTKAWCEYRIANLDEVDQLMDRMGYKILEEND